MAAHWNSPTELRMFDFFKKKTPAAFPAAPKAAMEVISPSPEYEPPSPIGTAVPQPLAGRNGHVGAIEALTLDGTLYFFGFDFRSDLVLSPLIADADLMARFASRHMAQRDGRHNDIYWRELVDCAVEASQLCSDEAGRSFDSQMLAATIDRLERVRRQGALDPGFAIEYHLRYLLGAAGGWEVPEEAGTDDPDLWIAQIAGDTPLDNGASLQHVASRLQTHLNALVDAAPGNWRYRFAALQR
jgi:hypothetical protein